MGFDFDTAKRAFEAFSNNFEKAANFLAENANEKATTTNSKTELIEKIQNLINPQLSPEMIQKKIQAQSLINKISTEMPDDDEAYLDLNTDEDAFFINKYYSLLD